MLSLSLFAVLLSVLTRPGVGRPTGSHVLRNVTLSVRAPASKQALDSSLVSFSLEGALPTIRVGADSADRFWYNDSIPIITTTTPNWTSITPYPEASYGQVSSRYYQLSKHMPAGTHMAWGLNLGSNNTENAVAQARAVKAAFSEGGAAHAAGIILDYYEVGNEPDYFYYQGYRTANYSFDDWVSEWSHMTQAVIKAVGIKPFSTPSIFAGSFGASTHSATDGWSPQHLIAAGVLNGTLAPYIKTVSGHHYFGSFCTGSGGLLAALMDKATIRANVTAFSPDVESLRAYGREFVYGETNSYACHGAPGVSDTAGAAIWTLDYVLQAASIGIPRVYFHEGVGYKYDLIQPVTLYRDTETGETLKTPLAAHVQPQYYAAIIATSFIGSARCHKEIAEITVPDAEVGGYAAYEDGVLKRAVFINNNAYLRNSTAARGSVSLDLKFAESSLSKPNKIEVRRLEIQYADDKSGLKFGGRSYETSTALPSGKDTFSVQKLSQPLVIQDTEAILVTFL
ncbi:glycoside hydrolase family 79 protein [Clavulina sp. PMI_390]|nr:glycoside hydrolase family 79 protein [Clavulina sp. PMI_390]